MSLAASSFADGKEFHLHTTSLDCRGHTYACATTSLAFTHGKISSRRLVNENRKKSWLEPATMKEYEKLTKCIDTSMDEFTFEVR